MNEQYRILADLSQKKRAEEERIENVILNQSFDTYYTRNPVNDSVTPKPITKPVLKPVLKRNWARTE